MSWLSESNNAALQDSQSLVCVGSIEHICRSPEGYVMRQNVILCCQIFFLLVKQTIWSNLFVLKPKIIVTEVKALANQKECHNISHKKQKCVDKFLYLKR